MAGFDLMGLLGSLVTDPYQQGGGLLSRWLNPNGSAAAGLNTPATPPPVAPSTGSPFSFRPGLLGDSLLGRGVRGALSGLAGSTGYTGISALGAGAGAATQAAQQRQLFNQQNLQAGQQYQGGQQSLIGGNIGNIFALEKVNAMIDDMNQGVPPGQQKPHVTINDLMQNPGIVNAIASQAAGSGAGAAAAGGTGEDQGGSTQGAAPPQVGMQPVYGGGKNVDPQVAQAYGPALAAGAPPAAPAAGGDTAPDAPPNAAPGDPNTMWVRQQMDSIRNLQWVAPDVYKEKLAEIQASPQFLAMSATTTAQAQEAAKFNSPQGGIDNVTKLASAYDATPAVKTMAEVAPNYQAVVASFNQAAGKTGALPSDFDLINGVIKMMNPNNANLRPNAAEALEEAKGYPSYIQKAVQAFFGGTGLTPEIRQTLKQVADQHMAAYQKQYDQSVQNFRSRATMLGPNVQESQWRSDMPAAVTYTEGQTASNAQGQKIVYQGGQWVPLQ